jgi:hypothetical protein
MNQKLTLLAVAACLGFAGSAFAADTTTGMSKDAYKAAKDKIEAQFKTDKKACDGTKGNAHELCEAEAKGKEKVAKAELEAQYKPGPKADAKVKSTKADADYEVAKEKCDDLQANAKDTCKKEAKATHDSAKAQAKADTKAAGTKAKS